jgi:hypothetical protein
MLRFIGRIEHFSQWRQITLTNKPSFVFILLGQQWNVTFWFQILNIVYLNFLHAFNLFYILHNWNKWSFFLKIFQRHMQLSKRNSKDYKLFKGKLFWSWTMFHKLNHIIPWILFTWSKKRLEACTIS